MLLNEEAMGFGVRHFFCYLGLCYLGLPLPFAWSLPLVTPVIVANENFVFPLLKGPLGWVQRS